MRIGLHLTKVESSLLIDGLNMLSIHGEYHDDDPQLRRINVLQQQLEHIHIFWEAEHD